MAFMKYMKYRNFDPSSNMMALRLIHIWVGAPVRPVTGHCMAYLLCSIVPLQSPQPVSAVILRCVFGCIMSRGPDEGYYHNSPEWRLARCLIQCPACRLLQVIAIQ